MKHSFARIILCFAVMTLVACASQKISVQHAREVRACINHCQQELKNCHQVCHNNCRECSITANCSAVRNYNRYSHEQVIQGGLIARQLKSYRDPLQCRKTTCDCSADYDVCKQSCEGLIHKRLQAGPACC